MQQVLERAQRGETHAQTLVLDTIKTRIEKMAAYFGRRCGVDEDDLRQEAWLAVLEMLPGSISASESPNSICSNAPAGAFSTPFADSGGGSI